MFGVATVPVAQSAVCHLCSQQRRHGLDFLPLGFLS